MRHRIRQRKVKSRDRRVQTQKRASKNMICKEADACMTDDELSAALLLLLDLVQVRLPNGPGGNEHPKKVTGTGRNMRHLRKGTENG